MAIDFSSEQIYARESAIPVPTTGTGDGGSESLTYILHSNSSAIETQRTEVVAWIDANAPSSLGGHDPANASIKEIADGYWTATLTYSTQQSQRNAQRETDVKSEGDNQWSFSFAITGESQRILLGRKLYAVYPPDAGLIADFGDKRFPIGLDLEDGTIQGIDVVVPQASWEESYWTDASNVTEAYRVTCLGLVGKVNNATFRGCAQHTALLTGVQGSLTSDTVGGMFQLTFTFAYKGTESCDWAVVNNDDAENPGFTPVTISKTGWLAWDIRYKRVKYGGVYMKLPKAILRHVVYEEGDFSQLNLP